MCERRNPDAEVRENWFRGRKGRRRAAGRQNGCLGLRACICSKRLLGKCAINSVIYVVDDEKARAGLPRVSRLRQLEARVVYLCMCNVAEPKSQTKDRCLIIARREIAGWHEPQAPRPEQHCTAVLQLQSRASAWLALRQTSR
jgi:hypothetical protein